MEITKKAIEMTGRINADRQLILDDPLPIMGPIPVRVIILLPQEANVDEKEWLRTAASNPAVDFLKKPEEDIYSPRDGRPFNANG